MKTTLQVIWAAMRKVWEVTNGNKATIGFIAYYVAFHWLPAGHWFTEALELIGGICLGVGGANKIYKGYKANGNVEETTAKQI